MMEPRYRTLVHINWGWSQGKYDGYYNEGVFDPSASALEVDTSAGDGGNGRYDMSVYKHIKTLTWSN